MNNLVSYWPLLAQGACMTVASWLVAGIISSIIGMTLGICCAQEIGSSKAIMVISIYSFITRGIPAYVQILIAYFVVPAATGINISGFTAATWALGLCSSGYVIQIVQSGMNAVPKGQWEACSALGFSILSTIRYIILPQATSIFLPAFIGEREQLLKSTSLLAAIGVTEVTRAGMNIISRELNPLPIYCMIACIYLMFSAIFNILIVCYQKKKLE
ncbi:amino acid ABC transporter permease [Candidatus Babeliales bacterium]|nr:amino acid ABC transporter permease [Candidatus Babeliales bacterium]MBP9843321.1 amino acid ABC transporter permease [Candidatus Babeliales bacterium]